MSFEQFVYGHSHEHNKLSGANDVDEYGNSVVQAFMKNPNMPMYPSTVVALIRAVRQI